MDKDNSAFDFDNDKDFNENFYKNIEKALGDFSSQEDTASFPEEATPIQKETTMIQKEITQEEESPQANVKPEKSDADNLEAKQQPEVANTSEKLQSEEENTSEELQSEKVNTAEKLQPELEYSIEKGQPTAENSVNEQQPVQDTDEDDIDDKLTDINSSLAKQISEELDNSAEEFKKMQKKKHLLRIQSGVALTLLCLIGFTFFLGATKPGNQLLVKLGINFSGTLWDTLTNNFGDSTDVAADLDYLDEDDLSSDAPELDPSTIVWPDHPGEGRQEDGVYNILLLGEEAIGMGDSRGRTDVIVIATMNTNNKTLKLTSLMRDNLVQIPGYKENKLNTAYEKGGIDLLYETIALNFDIRLDGCVKVNFANFEKIINEIGGLDLTLTEGEAEYLNTTNYISNPEYRNVIAGTQHLNGNQVLGYARVRKRSTITGNNNDYGRTDRHRIVLNAIYEKCKNKSKTELASMMFKFLPMITTDIDSNNFQMLLNSFMEMGMSSKDIEQMRIPVDGAFEDNVRVRGMSVLIPDLEKNIAALHSFIFGDAIITEAPDGADISGSAEESTDNTGNTSN